MRSSSTNSAAPTAVHVGRPLDTSRDVALRTAALDLLAEIGYDRLTIEAVAARARAGKTTIYRRWSGKADLVVDALNGLQGSWTTPDTGTLRQDLESIARNASGRDNQYSTQLMLGLITALARDPELRRAFRERLIEPHKTSLSVVFQRARERGEIASDRNLELLVTIFPALMIHHLLTSGEKPDAAFAEQVMSDVVLPLATAP